MFNASRVASAGGDRVHRWQGHRPDEETQRSRTSGATEAKKGEQKEAIVTDSLGQRVCMRVCTVTTTDV